ncbi:MAG: GTPase [Holdemania massiliensis]
MIDADSSQQAQMAIQGIRGSIRRLIEPLNEALLNIIANIEVNIDYPEYEDAQQLTWESVLPQARRWLGQMDEILQRAESGRIMKKGVKTVILGKPNVGKSSLLNALLEEDKAIVTEIAGTTRDLVEGEIHLRNVTLHLIDTAGIHKTDDRVEQIGIERSMKALEEAELILIVLDASRPR